MQAAKRLQTIHLKDKQGRVVSSWQRVRVPVPDGISASLPPPYTGLKHLTKKVEHSLSPEFRVSRWQHRSTPYWKRISGGCHLDRKMDNLIRAAGKSTRSRPAI